MGNVSNLVKELENENFILKKSNVIMGLIVGKSLFRYEYKGNNYEDTGYVIAKDTNEAMEIIGYNEDIVMCTIMSAEEFMTLINHNAIHRIF